MRTGKGKGRAAQGRDPAVPQFPSIHLPPSPIEQSVTRSIRQPKNQRAGLIRVEADRADPGSVAAAAPERFYGEERAAR